MFARELRINAKRFWIWTLAMAVLFGGIVLAYSYMIDVEMIEMTDSQLLIYPQNVLRAFNMDIAPIGKASGWMKSEGLTIYTLVASLYAAILGSGILLKERANRTLEELWALPVSRSAIVLSHYMAGLLYVLMQHIIVSAVICGSLAIGKDFIWQEMLPVLCAPVLTLAVVYSVCFAVSTLFRKTGGMYALGFAGVLLSYVLHLVSRMGEKTEFLEKFSVFALSDVRTILERGAVSPQEICTAALIVLTCVFASLVVYGKRALI